MLFDPFPKHSATVHIGRGGRLHVTHCDHHSAPALRLIRKVAIAVLGGTVLILGLALLVLPGPAVLVIPAGLIILSIEFRWARRWLKRARDVLPEQPRDASPEHTAQRIPTALRRTKNFISKLPLAGVSEEERSPYAEDEPLR